MRLTSHLSQIFCDLFSFEVLERCCILELTFDGCKFSNKAFKDVSDGHSRRYAVRIDHQVRDDSFDSEGKVLLPVNHPDCSFLAMAGSKLVPDLWDFDHSCLHFSQSVSFSILGQEHAIDVGSLASFRPHRNVLGR